MTQPSPAVDDQSAEASADGPTSLRDYIRTTAINTVPPLLGYYGLRLFDVVPWLALVGAIAVAAVQGVLTMVFKKKFEPVNGLVILGAACSLVLAFVTKNARVVQAVELLPVSTLVWSLVVSGLLGKPTTLKLAAAFAPGLAEESLPNRGWTEQDIEAWRRLHAQVCVRLGLVCGAFPFVALVWIFTLSVDVSQILLASTGPTLVIACVAIAIAMFRRFIHQRDQAAAERAEVSPEPTA